MIYSSTPPYEILQNKLIDFVSMQRMRRFARYWELVGNSGNFVETTPLIWSQASSPFQAFMGWSDWLHGQVRRTDGIALIRLAEFLFAFLTRELGLNPLSTAQTLWRDYQRGGRMDVPGFLREYLPVATLPPRKTARSLGPKRQARHLAGQR